MGVDAYEAFKHLVYSSFNETSKEKRGEVEYTLEEIFKQDTANAAVWLKRIIQQESSNTPLCKMAAVLFKNNVQNLLPNRREYFDLFLRIAVDNLQLRSIFCYNIAKLLTNEEDCLEMELLDQLFRMLNMKDLNESEVSLTVILGNEDIGDQHFPLVAKYLFPVLPNAFKVGKLKGVVLELVKTSGDLLFIMKKEAKVVAEEFIAEWFEIFSREPTIKVLEIANHLQRMFPSVVKRHTLKLLESLWSGMFQMMEQEWYAQAMEYFVKFMKHEFIKDKIFNQSELFLRVLCKACSFNKEQFEEMEDDLELFIREMDVDMISFGFRVSAMDLAEEIVGVNEEFNFWFQKGLCSVISNPENSEMLEAGLFLFGIVGEEIPVDILQRISCIDNKFIKSRFVWCLKSYVEKVSKPLANELVPFIMECLKSNEKIIKFTVEEMPCDEIVEILLNELRNQSKMNEQVTSCCLSALLCCAYCRVESFERFIEFSVSMFLSIYSSFPVNHLINDITSEIISLLSQNEKFRLLFEKSLINATETLCNGNDEEKSSIIQFLSCLVDCIDELSLDSPYVLIIPNICSCFVNSNDLNLQQAAQKLISLIISKNKKIISSYSLIIQQSLLNCLSNGYFDSQLFIKTLYNVKHENPINFLSNLIPILFNKISSFDPSSQKFIFTISILIHLIHLYDQSLEIIFNLNFDLFLKSWINSFSEIQSENYMGRISILSLCKLLNLNNPSIMNFNVLKEIQSQSNNKIITRSKSKSLTKEFISIPFVVRAVELLIDSLNTIQSLNNNKQNSFEQDENSDDTDWEDDDECTPDHQSLLGAFNSLPTVEELAFDVIENDPSANIDLISTIHQTINMCTHNYPIVNQYLEK
ncbi:Armadillo-type fold domain-containing protein [Rozella allomycis CSF55]|uniref:Armadillo-type fold domain-containing protein n=1 Tax=Rozella allomycis (strain CSF55) TaxID=988480 RepID=A0A075ARJ6_ROZAC|nr:Armadillo-type fold domain-containing protein [Rozella allomycis CSF55]|eukprot:EPZ31122.1 Armadillo-type fold domain-containing protein [Rozella allomycis CSF55]